MSARPGAATPIKHLVVIFQENVSFDHYFGTYPRAENKPGEPLFVPLPGTPSVNGLGEPLLGSNPNSTAPFRLGRAQASTCDQDHGYGAEQRAAHGGLMDRFVENTGSGYPGCDPKLVMGYFDGNTVTALWNYAQHFAMSDNSYGTVFGPSTPGAINLVSGQTHGAVPAELSAWGERIVSSGTMISDPDPEFDDCTGTAVVHMTGRNVGDLLNRAGVSWGWFAGGFADCKESHAGSEGVVTRDYIQHHQPFQYYKTTANPHHLSPTGPERVGKSDRANHQYDLRDFWRAADVGNVPAVSFFKAPSYQDGHAGYSDPLHEQAFLVETLNRLQGLKAWKDMAVVIAYDDSDGWYDHVMPPIVSRSALAEDAVAGPGSCGTPAPGAYQGRCGYGPRLPLLVVSPWAKTNHVDHAVTDQTSILRFIEDNWGLGRIGDQSFDEKAGTLEGLFDFGRREPAPKLLLDPETGRPR